jgi:hypothetical protein
MTLNELRTLLSDAKLQLLQDDVVEAAKAKGRSKDLDDACEDLSHAIDGVDNVDLTKIQQRLAANEAALKQSTNALKAELKNVENIGKIVDRVAQVVGIAAQILA